MEGAATVPPRAAGQRIVLRRMAPARVAASAMLQRLRAAVAVGRPRNAFRDRAWRSLARAGHKARSTRRSADCDSISGQMVERIVAIGVTQARFPADALFLALRGPFFSRGIMSKPARGFSLSRARGARFPGCTLVGAARLLGASLAACNACTLQRVLIWQVASRA